MTRLSEYLLPTEREAPADGRERGPRPPLMPPTRRGYEEPPPPPPGRRFPRAWPLHPVRDRGRLRLDSAPHDAPVGVPPAHRARGARRRRGALAQADGQ